MAIAPEVPLPPTLLDGLAGTVITADAPGYEASRQVFYHGFDRRPAAIIQPADVSDVARVVAGAHDADLELTVRGGGHSLAGHGASAGGVVLDLSSLRSLDIDVAGRTAWAGAGLTAGQYTAAVGAHGLATGFGDAGSVGIAGITLGGGIGFLVREHGLTIDQLLAAEIVTADGKVRHTDADLQPELFWALRGGGGNFGVVTRLRFRLHAVGQVMAGALVLPVTPEVIEGFIAAARSAPGELSTILNVMSAAPPVPFIPEQHHGAPVAFALVCHAGSLDAAERDLAPFRSLAEPLADLVAPMAYPELFPPEEERPPFAGAVIRSGYLDDLGPAATQAITDHLATATGPMAAVQLRVVGGAVDAVAADATAYAHRGRPIMANVVAAYLRSEDAPQRQPWVADLADRLFTDDAAYVGFLGDDSPEQVRAAYPGATWDRLRRIKRRYDPENLFRHNHNIPPASVG